MIWVFFPRRICGRLRRKGALALVPAEETCCCCVLVAHSLQKYVAVLVSFDEVVAKDTGEDGDGGDEGAGTRILGNCHRSLVALG